MLLQEQRTVCIKVDVIHSSGLLLDSIVLDETWALARLGTLSKYRDLEAYAPIESLGEKRGL